jgi:uncharacterized protein (DUF362 family)
MAKEARVAVVKGEEARTMVAEAVGLVGGMEKFVRKGSTVLIKPNLGFPPPQGKKACELTTEPAVVQSLIALARAAGAKKVLVGDGPVPGISSRFMFNITGMEKAVTEAGGEVRFFDEEPYATKEVPGGIVLRKANLPRAVLEADIIINAAKMKTHPLNKVTLGFKNLVGLHRKEERPAWHRMPQFAYYLVDLAKCLKPALTVIDAIVAMEGRGPVVGDRVDMGLIICGEEMLSVETVASALMGFDPAEIPSIAVAAKDWRASRSVENIEVIGEPTEKARRFFKRAVASIVHPAENVAVYPGGACFGCELWIDRTPPPFEAHPDRKYAVLVGETPKFPHDGPIADEVWLLGNCAIKQKTRAKGLAPRMVLIKGCPPHAWFFKNVVLRQWKIPEG